MALRKNFCKNASLLVQTSVVAVKALSIVLQSMTQLESMYSHAEATTIINNCDHIIYLGSQDLKTADYIAHRINKTPENVLMMPGTDSIVITKGEKAVQVKKIVPYSTLEPKAG